jgi:hypothetical protein
MNRNLLNAVALVAGPLLWATGAQAAQITFGPSNESITFTGNGANSVSVTSPTLTGSAFDTTNGAVGTFTISALSFTAGPQSAGIFNAGPIPKPSPTAIRTGIASPRPGTSQ